MGADAASKRDHGFYSEQKIKSNTMEITEIVVTAGRTFNHPHEEYSNLRPSVLLKATLAAGEAAVQATKTLQQQAEQLVEDHKQNLLKSLEDIYELGEAKTRMLGLARQMKSAQDELDALRKQWPQMEQLKLSEHQANE